MATPFSFVRISICFLIDSCSLVAVLASLQVDSSSPLMVRNQDSSSVCFCPISKACEGGRVEWVRVGC